MKKITIEVGGIGSKVYCFDLSIDQKEELKKIDLSNTDISNIFNIIGVQNINECNRFYYGSYLDGFILKSDQESWSSLDGWSPILYSESDNKFLEFSSRSLLIEEYSEGIFFECFLNLDEEFHPSMISPIYSNISGKINIITDLRYKGSILPRTISEYNISKGYYYHL